MLNFPSNLCDARLEPKNFWNEFLVYSVANSCTCNPSRADSRIWERGGKVSRWKKQNAKPLKIFFDLNFAGKLADGHGYSVKSDFLLSHTNEVPSFGEIYSRSHLFPICVFFLAVYLAHYSFDRKNIVFNRRSKNIVESAYQNTIEKIADPTLTKPFSPLPPELMIVPSITNFMEW